MLNINETERPDFIDLSERMNILHSRKVFTHAKGVNSYIYDFNFQNVMEMKL